MKTTAVHAAVLLAIGASAAAQTMQPAGTMRMPAAASVLAISPSGTEVAALGADHALRLLSTSGAALRTVDHGSHEVSALAYSRDGKRLAMAFKDGGVRVVQAATGAAVRDLAPSTVATYFIALSPDGRYLAVSPLDVPAQLWDVERGVKIANLATPFSGANALAFSPDGKLVASADGDANVRVYDVPSGTPRSKYESLLLESFSVAFSPDSKSLVIGGADRVVVTIDPATGKETHRLAAQKDPVIGVAFLGDGHAVVASCFNVDHMSEGKNTIAWDLTSGLSKVLTSGKSFAAATVASDGRLMLAEPDGTTLKLWAVR